MCVSLSIYKFKGDAPTVIINLFGVSVKSSFYVDTFNTSIFKVLNINIVEFINNLAIIIDINITGGDNMDKGRGIKMAKIILKKPDLLFKLTATSLGLTTAVAKLYEYRLNTVSEIKKDIQYVMDLENAYLDSAELDYNFAESLSGVSSQVDKFMLKKGKDDE